MKPYLVLKRIIDLSVSFLLIFVLSPILIIISVILKLESEGPLLFKQTRIGIHSQPFTINKFRTMYITTPKYVPTNQLENPQQYVTKVGRFLRKSSLDELPQLINIIKNEMSLVGPRPVIPEEVELIERRRELGVDAIKPGVTGWAQVNGRDELDYIEKSKNDNEYLQRIGLIMDLKIIFLTVQHVLVGKHISH